MHVSLRRFITTLFFLTFSTFLPTPVSAEDRLEPACKLMQKIKDQTPHIYRILEKETPQFFSHAQSAEELHHDFLDKSGKMLGIAIMAALVMFLDHLAYFAIWGKGESFKSFLYTNIDGEEDRKAADLLKVPTPFVIYSLAALRGALIGWNASFGDKLAPSVNDFFWEFMKYHILNSIFGIAAISKAENACQNVKALEKRAANVFFLYTQARLFFSVAPRLRNKINDERRYAEAIIRSAVESKPDLPEKHPLKQLLKHF